jgi:hypothetical protein
MTRARPLLVLAVAVSLATAASPAPAAQPAPAPALSVTSLATPTNFEPGGEPGVEYTYDLRIANLGGENTDGGPITVTDTLPKGLSVKDVAMFLRSTKVGDKFDYAAEACHTQKAGEVETVICEISEGLPESVEPAVVQPAEERRIVIEVDPPAVGTPEGERLSNHVLVEGGGSPPASTTSAGEASSSPAAAGVSLHASITEADGQPSSQAGAHPYQLTIGFALNTRAGREGAEAKFVPAGGDVKDIEVSVPPGLVGNPTAVSRCSPVDFNTSHTVVLGIGSFTATACPDSSAVGLVLVQQIEGVAGILPVPLYNITPPNGVVAEFGAQIQNLPFYIDFEARPDRGYEVVANLRNLTQLKRVTATTTIIWGNPSDSLHDPIRGGCVDGLAEFYGITVPGCVPQGTLEEKPFLRLPTSCSSPLDIDFGFDNWTVPGEFINVISPGPMPIGCAQVAFDPSFAASPTNVAADSPTGLHARLEIPQSEDPEGLGTADLRKTVVALPKGLSLNPSAANGLEACSPAQIGYEGKVDGVDAFSNEPARCSAASRIGTVKVKTPLIDHVLQSGGGGDGSVYVATPHDNPFGSLLAIYLAVHDPKTGVIVKIAGKTEADPVSGQLTTTFDETPQLPVESFELDLFDGPLAALRTPAVCGDYSTTAELTPWSAPVLGPPATSSSSFRVSRPAAGQGSCPASAGEMPNKPAFEAGTVTPTAGAYSPFVMRLRRDDGSQEFSKLTTSLPPGLLARLVGIPYCPDAAIAAAAQRQGRAEQQSPSCPPASEVGTLQAGAGAGTSPYYASGRAYLAGPYKGAPLSLAVVAPAVAGPFDLGTIVVRAALYVNPETGVATAKSDPIPHILQGIGLDVRSLAMKLDRPNFMLNPTNCNPLAFSGELTSTLGQSAPLSARFQVGKCARLRFRPSLSFSLKGGTRRGDNPAVRAVLTYPKKGAYANIARTRVILPHSEFLDNAHLDTICTRVQFAADACPKGAIYGHARATTPLLDKPLSGPVYLRSSSHELPDLVASLNGQVPIVLVGRIDSVKNGRISTTFENLPDAPVSKVVLDLKGGRKGILVNSANLCRGTHRAIAKFTAQNNKYTRSEPVLKAKCPEKTTHKKRSRQG